MKFARFAPIILAIIIAVLVIFSVKQKKAIAVGDVLATVNGQEITTQDLQNRITTFPQKYRVFLQEKDNQQKILKQMINARVLLAAAQEGGIQNIKKFKQHLIESQNDDMIAMLNRSLILQNNTEESLQNKLIAQQLLKKKFSASEEEQQDYYKNSISHKISHILVATEKEAKDILQQIKSGADFATLAKEKSLDRNSAQNGGDIGVVSREELLPEVGNAVVSLNNKNPTIVKSSIGYHIIKLTDEAKEPFVKLRKHIEKIIIKKKEAKAAAIFLDGQKKKYLIELANNN